MRLLKFRRSYTINEGLNAKSDLESSAQSANDLPSDTSELRESVDVSLRLRASTSKSPQRGETVPEKARQFARRFLCNSLSTNSLNHLSSSALPKLPKNVELALRYLQEIIRNCKPEMFAGTSNAFFDAVLQYLRTINTGKNNKQLQDKNNNEDGDNNTMSAFLNNALNDDRELSVMFESFHNFMKWMDEQIAGYFCGCGSEEPANRSHSTYALAAATSAVSEQNAKQLSEHLQEGLNLLKEFEQMLRKIAAISKRAEHHAKLTASVKCTIGQAVVSPSDSRRDSTEKHHVAEPQQHLQLQEQERSSLSFIDTGQFEDGTNEFETINRLLEQISSRKLRSFEPQFASIARPEEDPDEVTINEKDEDSDESEDDSGVNVDDEHEERAERYVDETHDERVNRNSDGSETHTHRHVTSSCTRFINTRVSKRPAVDENAQQERATSYARQMWINGEEILTVDPHDNQPKYTVVRNLQHTDTHLRYIAQREKQNGNSILEDCAHQLDAVRLSSHQVADQFNDACRLELRDGADYKEISVVNYGRIRPNTTVFNSIETSTQNNDANTTSQVKRRVCEYEKKIGEKFGDGRENFFKTTTLACYLTLNDNLRFYEEHQRKKVEVTFSGNNNTGSYGNSGGTIDGASQRTGAVAAGGYTTPDFVNLRQLLQAASVDATSDETIRLPTQFLDDTDESDVEKIITPKIGATRPTTVAIRTTTTTTTTIKPSLGADNVAVAPRGNNGEIASADFRLNRDRNGSDVGGGDCERSVSYEKRTSDNILESLDVSEFLVLRSKEPFSKPSEVRGGPKTALIVYATQNCSLLYQEAFIVTYRSFVNSRELVQKLIKRYWYMSSSEKKAAHRKAARQTFSVLVRVVHELCGLELTRELINVITSFIYRLIRSGNYEFARILRRRLMEIIEEKSLQAHNKVCPNPKISSNNKVFCGPTTTPATSAAPAADSSQMRTPSIFEFRSSALAKQITYLDAELLNRIEPAEMLWWAEEQDEKKSPNVVAFTEHFNRVSYWVRTQVIMQTEQRDREKYLLKFIKIMKQLRKLGNYNSYLAILSALDSGPIRRLDWPRNLREQLAEHAEIMESSHSFKNYRTLLADTVPPCLPYIGLILQDLTFVHVGNPDYLFADKQNADGTMDEGAKLNRKNLLNYGKRWQQFAILDNIRRFKTWPYDIRKDEKVLAAFNNFSDFLPEEETWERSFDLKARTQRQRQKLSS